MRDGSAGRRGAFAEVDVRDRAHAVAGDRPAAGCPRDRDAGIAGVGRLVGALGSRFARVGGVQRDRERGRRRAGVVLGQVRDRGGVEDQLEPVIFEGVALAHAGGSSGGVTPPAGGGSSGGGMPASSGGGSS